MRRPTLFLNVLLLNFSLFSVMPAVAQQDSDCFWQNSTGQTVDLSRLCRSGTAPKATGRATECKTFQQLMKRTMVADQIIEKPATAAQRNRNTQTAKKLDRSAATVRTAKFSDPQVKTMQGMAIEFYQDMAKYARAWNQIGARPTQNQGFAISSVGQSAVLTYLYLDDTYTTTCGQKLTF